MQSDERESFIETVWEYYRANGRHDLPWRLVNKDGTINPYHVMVSELMLQQTQVARVIPKYKEFVALFPTVQVLSRAGLADVLTAWQGLGYNRRAKFLWQAAQILDTVKQFPDNREELVKLPGIGPNTSGAILAYAFNRPDVFVETNIRSVFIHHFFNDRDSVSDQDIRDTVAATLDHEHPREWYWALMDYGTHLKATSGNAARASKHYAKQSRFEGSLRQVRGQVLRLLSRNPLSRDELERAIPDDRLNAVLATLETEGLISRQGSTFHLG